MTFVVDKKSAALGRTCVVGLGSEFGDDRLAWYVIDGLRKVFGQPEAPQVQLLDATTPADLIGSIEGVKQLFVIDACQGLGAPGEILQLVWPTPQIAKIRHPFGHNLTLHDVLELAAKVEQLPGRCEVWCIEGRAFEFGQPLSQEVEAAAEQMVTEIVVRLSQP